jgi:hypothetical protein
MIRTRGNQRPFDFVRCIQFVSSAAAFVPLPTGARVASSLWMAKELSQVDRLQALRSFGRYSPDALIGAVCRIVSSRTVK